MPTSPAHRVVIDTNVVLALWLFSDPRLTPLRCDVEQARLQWVLSPRMMDEISHELRVDRCARYDTTPESVHRRLAEVPMGLLTVEPRNRAVQAPAMRCSDPADQVFVDAALECRATWLLSRDRAVLKLARHVRHCGLTVCTPEHWLAAQGLPRPCASAGAPEKN